MRWIQATAIMASVLAAATAGAQTTYYVDGTCGNDSWEGWNSNCADPNGHGPKLHIQAALDVADPNDIVIVYGTSPPVTYAGFGNVNLEFYGQAITLRSSTGNPRHCIINGGGANRAFIFDDGETRDAQVFGIRMINCDSNDGGAVYCDQSSPTFGNCIFNGNSATSWGGAVTLRQSNALFNNHCVFYQNSAGLYGGAVYAALGSYAEFIDCDFYYLDQGNSAQRGGALHALSNADLTLTGCEFNNNTASTHGGAVYIDNSSDPSFANCSFDGNSAVGDGGACFIDRTSQPTFSTCTFGSVTENTAGLRGGAVHSRDGSTATFDGCSFDDCSAGLGGGAVFGSDTVINISGSTFASNVAGTRGGALRVRDISTAEVTDCEFLGNSASVNGGAIASSHGSDVTVTGGNFTQNVATDKGGGLASENGTATVSGGAEFAGNHAADGGAIANLGGSITVSNCDFIGNNVDLAGAGLLTDGGDATVTGSTFSGNIAVIAGGGLFAFESPSVTVEDSSFDHNRATGTPSYGGAIAIERGPLSVARCFYEWNEAVFGGALSTSEGFVSVDACDFLENIAGSAGGGAYHIDADPNSPESVEYKWCRFVGNVAGTGGGGGVAIHDLPATLHNCDFYGNGSYDCGGAIDAFAQVTTSFDLANCVFSCNTAVYAGGAVRVSNSGTSGPPITTGTIGNCTFSGNEATDPAGTGGGLLIGGVAPGASDVGVDNSIFWENLDSSGNTFDAQIYLSPGSLRRFDNSCFTAPACPPASHLRPPIGTGTNICAAPLFLNPSGLDGVCGTEDDNLRLMVGSPCIDAADSCAVRPDTTDLDDNGDTGELTPLDLDALARFVDDLGTTDTGLPCPPDYPEVVDMGAYEFHACLGDIDGDGDTDHSDLGELLAAWCTQEGDPNWNPNADLDGDGHVGHGDLGILLADWGCGT